MQARRFFARHSSRHSFLVVRVIYLPRS